MHLKLIGDLLLPGDGRQAKWQQRYVAIHIINDRRSVFRDQQDVDACVLGIRNTPKLVEEDLKYNSS